MSSTSRARRRPCACFVLTVSDTRTPDTDTSGRAIRDLLEEAGHTVTGHAIVRDEPAQVTATVRQRLDAGGARVIITTGGTGITSRDGTFEAIDGAAREAPRRLRRAVPHAQLPGDRLGRDDEPRRRGDRGAQGDLRAARLRDAVRLAMTRLILPELGHVVQQLSR